MFGQIGSLVKRYCSHVKKIFKESSIAELCILIGQVSASIYVPVRVKYTDGLSVNLPLLGSLSGGNKITLPNTNTTLFLSFVGGYWAGGSIGNGIGQIIHAWLGLSLNVTRPEGATEHPPLTEQQKNSNLIFLLKLLPIITTSLGLYALLIKGIDGGKPIFISVEELTLLEQIIETIAQGLYFGRTLAVRSIWLDKVTNNVRVADFGIMTGLNKVCGLFCACCARRQTRSSNIQEIDVEAGNGAARPTETPTEKTGLLAAAP